MAGQHFSTLPLTRARQLDVATQLRDFGATISAATEEPAIAVLRWHRHTNFKLVVDAKPYTGYTAGTNEWTISLEAASVEGEAFVEVTNITLDGSLGSRELNIGGEAIAAKLPDVKPKDNLVMRIKASPTGSPGELDYSAYLTV